MASGLGLAFLVGACDTTKTGQDDGAHATDAERCGNCQQVLADCSSESNSDASFVACRDSWRQCLATGSLGPGVCVNPLDQKSCEKCRIALTGCKDESGTSCTQQFTTCKTRLITRTDLRASCAEQDDRPPEVSCAACQDELASCLFDSAVNSEEVCVAGFDVCRGTAGLTSEVCRKPIGEEGCAMCQSEMQVCEAAGVAGCDEGFSRCRHALAQGVTCGEPLPPDPPGEGGAGAGGSGPGQPDDDCAHDPCETGVALENDCDPCAAAICAQDEYCCSTEWDATCVGEAEASVDCVCEGGPVDPPACLHSECSSGTQLEADCSSCAESVCQSDDYCCTVEWDDVCVGAAETDPSCACTPPAPACAHDPCGTGIALEASCDDCASEVCAGDAYCCDVEWDDLCVDAAGTAASCWCSAPSSGGPEVEGCAHDPCVSGEQLDPSCDDCASEVCAADSFCCETSWDSLCVEAAEEAAACWCN